MPILAYSTSVPVEKTISEITRILVRHGARSIIVDYDDAQQPIGLVFVMKTKDGDRPYSLPANVNGVKRALEREYNNRQGVSRSQTMTDHAKRVAWRIVKIWMESQIAIVESGMVSLEQALFPYLEIEQGKTLFALWESKQLALPPGVSQASKET